MINVRALVNPITSRVNPNTVATLKVSSGYTTNSAGSRTPTYDDVEVVAQVQPAASGDLRQAEGLNIQGIERVAYLYPSANGAMRPEGKGGDLLVFDAGTLATDESTWLVTGNLEQWPNWCKVALTRQNGA